MFIALSSHVMTWFEEKTYKFFLYVLLLFEILVQYWLKKRKKDKILLHVQYCTAFIIWFHEIVLNI